MCFRSFAISLIDTSLWSSTCIIVVVVVFVGVLISRFSSFFRGWFPWVGGGRFCSCLLEILDSESARWSDYCNIFDQKKCRSEPEGRILSLMCCWPFSCLLWECSWNMGARRNSGFACYWQSWDIFLGLFTPFMSLWVRWLKLIPI